MRVSPEEEAHALGFADTSKRSAGRSLALERGVEESTRRILQQMAGKYRRSLLVFYLEAPPSVGDRGEDFRAVSGAQPSLYNPLLDALLRDIRKRQDIVRVVQEEVDARPVDFVGTASLKESVANLASHPQFSYIRESEGIGADERVRRERGLLSGGDCNRIYPDLPSGYIFCSHIQRAHQLRL